MEKDPAGKPPLSDKNAAQLLNEAIGQTPPAAVVGRGWTPPSVESLTAQIAEYEVIELIGQGGMGAVYKARHPKLDRMVAVKVLGAVTSEDDCDKLRERFKREVSSLARLHHQNIVCIYDYDVTADGQPYYVMEYVHGSTLKAMLSAGKLDAALALEVVSQLCDSLCYLHSEGFIHRDIKPSNILVGLDGSVKLADFGLAKPAIDGTPGMTVTGGVVGTPGYMSPEREQGIDVDHRDDIWALGTLLYELLTGKPPSGTLDRVSQFAPKNKRAGKMVEKIVARSHESLENRYQQAGELKSDVEQAQKKVTPKPRNVKRIAGLSLSALAVLSVAAWIGWRSNATYLDNQRLSSERKKQEWLSIPFVEQLLRYNYLAVVRHGEQLVALVAEPEEAASSTNDEPGRVFEYDGEGIRFHYRRLKLIRIEKGGVITPSPNNVTSTPVPIWLKSLGSGAIDIDGEWVRVFYVFKSRPGTSQMCGELQVFSKRSLEKSQQITVFDGKNRGWTPRLSKSTLEVWDSSNDHMYTYTLKGRTIEEGYDVPMPSTEAKNNYDLMRKEQSQGLLPNDDEIVAMRIYEEFR